MRKLLAQALRNHRHLGLLMPPAHVRLLRAREVGTQPELGRSGVLGGQRPGQDGSQAERHTQELLSGFFSCRSSPGWAEGIGICPGAIYSSPGVDDHPDQGDDSEVETQTTSSREYLVLHSQAPQRLMLDRQAGSDSPRISASWTFTSLDTARGVGRFPSRLAGAREFRP